MALTRICPFCLEPAVECVCEIDEPGSGSADPGEDDVMYHVGGDEAPAAAPGLTVLRTAAEGAAETPERKLAILREAVQKVLGDEESGESGWGPDVHDGDGTARGDGG